MDCGAFVGYAGCADEGGLEGVVVDFWEGHIYKTNNSQRASRSIILYIILLLSPFLHLDRWL